MLNGPTQILRLHVDTFELMCVKREVLQMALRQQQKIFWKQSFILLDYNYVTLPGPARIRGICIMIFIIINIIGIFFLGGGGWMLFSKGRV